MRTGYIFFDKLALYGSDESNVDGYVAESKEYGYSVRIVRSSNASCVVRKWADSRECGACLYLMRVLAGDILARRFLNKNSILKSSEPTF